MQDFEKLGQFYLGKEYDVGRREIAPRELLYDSKDLTTHAVCVGMTGSGKTGLGIALLEEAAIDGIPAIAIDPKGDLGNLLLGFPELRPADFLPWVDPDEAGRKGLTREEFAARTAETVARGAGRLGPGRCADRAVPRGGGPGDLHAGRLRRAADDRAPLVRRAAAGPGRTARGLSPADRLGRLGAAGAPGRRRRPDVQPRAHPALQRLRSRLARGTQPGHGRADPCRPVAAVPEGRRPRPGDVLPRQGPLRPGDEAEQPAGLARVRRLAGGRAARRRRPALHAARASRGCRSSRSLISPTPSGCSSSPSSSTRCWPGPGRSRGPRACAPSSTWTRSSATSPRPPTRRRSCRCSPCSSRRCAYGLGVVLATQNPVDLDYKGLSNAGTWFIGRLQTQRDKDRVLEGLEGAFDRLGARLRPPGDGPDPLGAGAARLRDEQRARRPAGGVPDPMDAVLSPRPDDPRADPVADGGCASRPRPGRPRRLRRGAIRSGRIPGTAKESPSAAGASASSALAAAGARPVVPPDVPVFFVPRRAHVEPGESILYRPAMLGVARLHYADKKAGVDHWETLALLQPVGEAMPAEPWAESLPFDDGVPELDKAPEAGAASRPCRPSWRGPSATPTGRSR